MGKRIGIVGVGIAGAAHAASALANPDVSVPAVVRRRMDLELPDFLAGTKVCRSIDELIEFPGLDGIVIASPHAFLARQTCAAMTRFPKLLVEKPLATSHAECTAIQDMAQKTGAQVMVGYPRRLRNHWRTARAWVEQGQLGELVAASCRWSDPFLASYFDGEKYPTFRSDASDAVRGALLDSGSHAVDATLWVTGLTVHAVGAVFGVPGPLGLDAATVVSFSTKEGPLIALQIFRQGKGGGQTRELVIDGTERRLVVNDHHAVLVEDGAVVESVAARKEGSTVVNTYVDWLSGAPHECCNLATGVIVARVIAAAYDTVAPRLVSGD